MKQYKSESLARSFFYAFCGIKHTLISERNFKIHIVFTILAVFACIIFPVKAIHVFMIVYAIFFVLCMELINTAVEAVIDMCCEKERRPLAKIAKDCCAGAVLLASVQAVIIGLYVAWYLIVYMQQLF